MAGVDEQMSTEEEAFLVAMGESVESIADYAEAVTATASAWKAMTEEERERHGGEVGDWVVLTGEAIGATGDQIDIAMNEFI